MNYKKSLLTRGGIAITLLLLGYNLIYLIFSPLTFYLSYFSMGFYKPVLDSGAFIIGDYSLKFIPACTAASAYLLLMLLILFTKDISFKKGMKMFLLGSLLILALNIIRIDILIVTLIEAGKDYFNLIHLLFWKILSTIYVVLVWIFLTYQFKIKTIPIYSDIKYLLKRT